MKTKNTFCKLFSRSLKIIIAMFAIIFFSTNVSGQVYTGGNVSVNYDQGYYLDIAPLIGYRVGIVDVGASPFYSYSQRENAESSYSFGGRIFTQLTFYKDIFGHAELQFENIGLKDESRMWTVSMPIGAGYRYPIGEGTTAYGMVLYDVLLHPDSPNRNPIIRGGITHDF